MRDKVRRTVEVKIKRILDVKTRGEVKQRKVIRVVVVDLAFKKPC